MRSRGTGEPGGCRRPGGECRRVARRFGKTGTRRVDGGARAARRSALHRTPALTSPPLQSHPINRNPLVAEEWWATSWSSNSADATPLLGSWNPDEPGWPVPAISLAVSRRDGQRTVSTFTHSQPDGIAVQSGFTESWRYPRMTLDRYIGDTAGRRWGWDAARRVPPFVCAASAVTPPSTRGIRSSVTARPRITPPAAAGPAPPPWARTVDR